jgi:iron complex outermembrane receptor protein
MVKGNRARRLALCAMACGLAQAPAMAQSAATSIAQPAMPLDKAVSALADRLGLQILFDPTLLRGKTAPAVQGRMSARAALTRLLAGSGIEAQSGDGHIFVLQRAAPKARRVAPVPAPTEWPDIVVTAARYPQKAERTSASLDVIRGENLAQHGLFATEQALSGLPGINTNRQPDGVSINIRGLGADMPSGTTQGSVALEFDGISSIMALGTGLGWYDVDRVEVTKGPQSTRYGPNAEGGVVNVITRHPMLGDAGAYANVTLGSAGLVRGEFGQSLRLGDTVALRMAGMAVRRRSWFDPGLAQTANQSLRAGLLFAPQPDLSLRVTVETSHLGGTGSGSEAGTPYVIDKVAPYAGDSINQQANLWAMGDRAGAGMDLSQNHANLWQTAITSQVSLPLGPAAQADVSLAHLDIAGHQTICAHDGAPWLVSGAGQCLVVHEFAPFYQNSAELRFHSPDGRPFMWSFGAYYWRYGKSSFSQVAGGSQLGSQTLALFGESTVPLGKAWRAVVGLRQSWDHRLLRPTGLATTYTADFDHTDVRLGVEHDLGPSVFHYATLSSGYRPGGLTYDGAAGTALRFDSQSTLALESGVKFHRGTWLQIDLAAFAYRQRHYQHIDNYYGFAVKLADGSSYVCGPGSDQPAPCSVPVFTIARASNVGLEAAARVRPTASDELAISGSFMRARFGRNLGACATVAAPSAPGCWIGYNDQFTGALHFYRADGTAQFHAPTLSLNLSYQHKFRLRAGYRLEAGGDVFHTSGYWLGPVQDQYLAGWQPAYWQGNISARIVSPTDRASLGVYVRNLGNYAVKMSALPATTIGDPRNVGLSLDWKW